VILIQKTGGNSPDYLKQRHHLTGEQEKLIAAFGSLLADAVK
jgi:hypothetical protein